MSLVRLRRSSRFVAALLLLAATWQLPHRSLDDEICAPAAEAHDESKHVFTEAEPAEHGDHCAICHWTRWLKPISTSRGVAASIDASGDEFVSLATVARRDPSTEQLPPRAPPSHL